MVTSIKDLQKQQAGSSEVELPGFVYGKTFTARLRRPSMLMLANDGKIPNPLLSAAAELFRDGAGRTPSEGEAFKKTAEVYACIAKASLVEPTWEELEAAGINLTDEQIIRIYLYAQTGVQSLAGFRKEPGDYEDSESGNVAE